MKLAITVLAFLYLSFSFLNIPFQLSFFQEVNFYLLYFLIILYFIDLLLVLITSDFYFPNVIPDLIIILFLFLITSYPHLFSFLLPKTAGIRIAMSCIFIRYFFFLRHSVKKENLKKIQINILENPAQTVILSYIILILSGALLLLLPISCKAGKDIGFLDAVFTATSASCVTGLVVEDTGTTFSIFGQIVILLQIQFGGLGIMIFSSLITFLFNKRISLEETKALSFQLNETEMNSIYKTIKIIISLSFLIEGVGAVALFFQFYPLYSFSLKTCYYAVFHSVSAFCNAGFSLFPDNLISFQSSPITIFTFSFLIILGGLSFNVILNLYHYLKYRILQKLRKQQNREPWYLTENTKIVLLGSVILILGGTYLLYALEHDNILLKLSMPIQYMTAFFQSVTLRTCGFNTIDFSQLTRSSHFVMLFFMYIGGSAGSTAGGLKINTSAILLASVKSFMKERKQVVLFNKSISRELVLKSFVSFFLSITVIFFSIFIVSLTDPRFSLLEISFEVVSAFSTVGLSTGITAQLSDVAKIISICLMFIGKVGTLTLFTAIFPRKNQITIEYPSANIMAG